LSLKTQASGGMNIKIKIKKMKNKIWYVAYGSNILKERFMAYINGGKFRDIEKIYIGCTDKTPPQADKAFTLPYKLYFGGESKTWNDKGVAFIDENTKGETKGRAYLITEEQFNEVQKQEGISENWYGHTIEMGKDENGIPYKTFTSKIRHSDNAPDEKYLEVINEGLLEIE
jgi:hypothetical protein